MSNRTALLENIIGKPGGEGTVYTLEGKPHLVAKMYHHSKLEKSNNYEKKIGAMTSVKDYFKNVDVCWPLESVYKGGQWAGYVMKRAAGVPMKYLAHFQLIEKHFSNLDRIGLTRILLRFLGTVKTLHEMNIYIGDYNLLNFLCTRDKVFLIDCDSYQVSIQDTLFPCPVGSPDLTPLEHHNQDFNKVIRNKKSEEFSIAIVLFQCLMLGRHPFDVVKGDSPVKNMRNGFFPYGKGKGVYNIPKGPWYNIWSHIPYKIKSLFIQCFNEGMTQIGKRPTINEWYEALSIYMKDLKCGHHNAEIKPQHPKDDKYRGRKNV